MKIVLILILSIIPQILLAQISDKIITESTSTNTTTTCK